MSDTIVSADDSEVIVSLKLTFRKEAIDQLLEKFRPAIALTRAESGNNDFQLFKVNNTEDTFVIFERWKNKAALEWHWQQAHTREIIDLFTAHLVKPFSEVEDVTYLSDMVG